MPSPQPSDWDAFDSANVTLRPGDKLIKSRNYAKYNTESCPYQTHFSFLNVNGHIAAIDYGPKAVLGTGGFGKVKKAYLRDGSLWVLKMERVKKGDSSTNKIKQKERVEHESDVLLDLEEGLGMAERVLPHETGTYKYYILTKFQGETLSSYLEREKGFLPDFIQLRLAINVCLLTMRLHHGVGSKSQTSRAHLDIKPDNITRDDKGSLHFIDYAFSETAIKTCSFAPKGTPAYMPQGFMSITKEMRDVFALIRTIYLPERFYNMRGLPDRRQWDDEWILSETLIERLNLRDALMIDSKTERQKKYYRPPARIAALLILAYYNLTHLYDKLDDSKVPAIIKSFESCNGSQAVEALFKPNKKPPSTTVSSESVAIDSTDRDEEVSPVLLKETSFSDLSAQMAVDEKEIVPGLPQIIISDTEDEKAAKPMRYLSTDREALIHNKSVKESKHAASIEEIARLKRMKRTIDSDDAEEASEYSDAYMLGLTGFFKMKRFIQSTSSECLHRSNLTQRELTLDCIIL